jgi:hypothetical protein
MTSNPAAKRYAEWLAALVAEAQARVAEEQVKRA